MDLYYRPSQDATASGEWDTTFLSDRDVSAQVPVNFVPHPGIYVRQACFADNVYDGAPIQECLSNLLASQIRRFILDIYWDVTHRTWSLCPVEVPQNANNATADLVARAIQVVGPMDLGNHLALRQAGSSSSLNSTSNANSTSTYAKSTSTSTLQPSATYAGPVATATGESGNTLYQLGPYSCSNSLTLASIISLLNDFQAQTSTITEARVIYLILRLGTAAPYPSPTSPRTNLTTAELPTSSELVSTCLDNIASLLYTPTDLQKDRANLNSTWYKKSDMNSFPLSSYFTIARASDGTFTTDDGWPDEPYIQFNIRRRFFVGLGELDTGLRNYNYSGDGSRVYPPGYIYSHRNVSLDAEGHLTSGCFFDGQNYSLSQINSSWAVTAINTANPPDLGSAADNITTCGISPILNTTINGQLADEYAGPYQTFGNEAVFSWAYGEPKNDSAATGVADKFRCALMVVNSSYAGHWRVADCTEKHRVACREAHEPYMWTLSSYTVPYDSGDSACTGNSTFDVPRVGLENTYLYNHILGDNTREQNNEILNGIWVNFNSLDHENCWVTTGPNGTCPYFEDPEAAQQRQILVPAIAALIILILTVLTILVKCNSNRRNSKARRRGEGGWDYEGVPS